MHCLIFHLVNQLKTFSYLKQKPPMLTVSQPFLQLSINQFADKMINGEYSISNRVHYSFIGRNCQNGKKFARKGLIKAKETRDARCNAK